MFFFLLSLFYFTLNFVLVNNFQSSHQLNSDSSSDNSDDKPILVHPSIRQMEKRSLRYKRKQVVLPPVLPTGAFSSKECHSLGEGESTFYTRCEYKINALT